MIVNKTVFPARSNYGAVVDLQDRFATLQQQLATGKKAQTLSELGSDRSYDLGLRARLSRNDAYASSMQTVNLRLNVFDNVFTRLDSLESEARSAAAPGGYGTGDVNLSTAPNMAKSQMSELISLLNTDVNGRFLFGGSKSDSAPVQTLDKILNGDGGKAGFRTVAGERLQADLGDDGLGRLDVAQAGTSVSLDEDGDHPFGFKLGIYSTDSSGITLTQPSGTPQTSSIEVTGTVSAGDKVRIGLTLPDGSTTTLELTAVDGTPANPGEFSIGGTAADTAANLETGLQSALQHSADTDLTAASSYAAADNFFNAKGEQVMRVDGPPFDTATGLVAASSSDTVFWYTGEDGSGPARETVSAKVDDNTTINYGVQANESGMTALMRSLAVMSASDFSANDANAKARFDHTALTRQSRLSEAHNNEAGSIEVIALDLDMAQATMGQVQDRQDAYSNQLQSLLDKVESASPEEVAMELSSIQVRLQASYQTMATINQLTLVNYLR